ncbi:Mov34/MPN/PAD-1 family protein [Alicyclobacillus contaminans]|uniref:Mov34/MPN/PAD-1 family protein n=1 Tax=Alicyclobacillus contaminans TaxID=392016 RepID=UPI00054EC4A8|nr:Mov34/MPN/PAD-1 family protein [Alicyclobacillus contaminans]
MSSEAPPWWTASLAEACRDVAQRSLPNEACGLLVREKQDVQLWPLSATATATRVEALPEALVRASYELVDAGGRSLGTFHSHPDGSARFSKRDEGLLAWGEWHVVAYRIGSSWSFTFGRRSGATPEKTS